MYIFVWHMNSFKLVFAMVMYLSWKSTQIFTNKIFRKSVDKYTCQVWALGGQLHHHSSHLRDGRGKQLHDQGITLPKLVMFRVDQVDLMMLTKMAVLTIVGAIEDVDKLDLVNWRILTKLVVLNKLALLGNFTKVAANNSPEKNKKTCLSHSKRPALILNHNLNSSGGKYTDFFIFQLYAEHPVELKELNYV